MVDRIKLIMKYVQMSPAAFADALGIGRSNLTHIFSGRNQPSLDIVKKILKTFPEIQSEWLIMGMGNMLRENADMVAKPEKVAITTPVKPLPEHQTDLFDKVTEETVFPNKSLSPASETGEALTAAVYKSKSPAPLSNIHNKASVKPSKFNISAPTLTPDHISDSIDNKKITQIIFFFEDHSFEIYNPSKKPT